MVSPEDVRSGRSLAPYVRVSHEDFRGAVLDRPTERVKQPALLQVGGRAEVDELDCEVLGNDNVLILDVPVNDVL